MSDLVDDVRRVICEGRKDAVPDGWKLVPVGATDEMAEGCFPNAYRICTDKTKAELRAQVTAAITAAPDLLQPPCSFPDCTCHVAAKQSVELIESREKLSPAPDLVEECAKVIALIIARDEACAKYKDLVEVFAETDRIKHRMLPEGRRYAAAVIPIIVARERERCARIAEDIRDREFRYSEHFEKHGAEFENEAAGHELGGNVAFEIASAIRSNTE